MEPEVVEVGKRLRFDPTITAGHALQVIVVLVGISVAWAGLQAQNEANEREIRRLNVIIEREVNRTETGFNQLRLEIAKQGENISRHLDRLSDKLDRKEDKK